MILQKVLRHYIESVSISLLWVLSWHTSGDHL